MNVLVFLCSFVVDCFSVRGVLICKIFIKLTYMLCNLPFVYD